MKTKMLILFFTLLFTSETNLLFAQKANHVIRWNPLVMIVGKISLEYEMVLNNKMSLGTGANYMKFTLGEPLTGQYTFSGFGFNPFFRYYVTNKSKDAPTGFYVGPYIDYSNFTIEYTTSDIFSGGTATGSLGTTSFGVGAFLGYQWIFSDIVALDVYFGGGQYTGSIGKFKTKYSNGTEVESEYGGSFKVSGFSPTMGLSAGIAF